MTINFAKRAGAFSLAMLLGFAAQAATLDSIQGGVLVSRGGSGYKAVSVPTELRVGDTVLANPGGAARVVFDNGCAVSLQPGMVLTVAADPQCTSGGLKDGPVAGHGWSDYALPVGLAVVAGGAGLAIALSGGDDDDNGIPISAD